MGCFDSVWFKCPSCGASRQDDPPGGVEFQSKAGGCNLADYEPASAPPKVALDIIDKVGTCSRCLESFTARGVACVHFNLE